MLYWAIKLGVLAFLALRFAFRAKPARYGAGLLLAAGGIAWSALGGPVAMPWQPAPGAIQAVPAASASQIPPAPVVEAYLRSQAEYDGDAMWEGMNDALKRRLTTSGQSLTQLQAQLDSARKSDRRYSGVNHVGGSALNDGRAAHLYVVNVESPGGPTQMIYTFTVDRDGKIANIQ